MKIKVKLKKTHPYGEMLLGTEMITNEPKIIDIDEKFLKTPEVFAWFSYEEVKKESKTSFNKKGN